MCRRMDSSHVQKRHPPDETTTISIRTLGHIDQPLNHIGMGLAIHVSTLLEYRDKDLADLVESPLTLLVRLKPRSNDGVQKLVVFLQVACHCANVDCAATDCRQPFWISAQIRSDKHAGSRGRDEF